VNNLDIVIVTKRCPGSSAKLKNEHISCPEFGLSFKKKLEKARREHSAADNTPLTLRTAAAQTVMLH
jgi:hypothetical protein